MPREDQRHRLLGPGFIHDQWCRCRQCKPPFPPKPLAAPRPAIARPTGRFRHSGGRIAAGMIGATIVVALDAIARVLLA